MPRRGGSRPRPLRGYTRAGKNRWRTAAGREITDYEYRKRLLKREGWDSPYQMEKFRRSQTWKRWVLDVADTRKNYDPKTGKYVGPDLTYRGNLMRDAYNVERRQSNKEPLVLGGAREPLKDTDLGRLLIASGRRPEDSWWEYA